MTDKKLDIKREIERKKERERAKQAISRFYSTLTDKEKAAIEKQRNSPGYTPEEAEEEIKAIKNGEYEGVMVEDDYGPMILTDEEMINHIIQNTNLNRGQ